MRNFLPVSLAALAISSTGCGSTRTLNSLVKAMGKDPATVHVSIRTIYGTVEFSRTNPQTNSLPHTIGPDGTITVSKP